MRTLNISISDTDFARYGLKKEQLKFDDFIHLVKRELVVENLNASLVNAEKYGLSAMSMDEISAEVNAVRMHAKDRH